MLIALGVCHKDFELAVKWLEYVSALSMRESTSRVLLVMGTQTLNGYHWQMLHAAAQGSRMQMQWATCPDSNEVGYPVSASHLFLRTLEHCEAKFPEESVLWVEPDAVPMRAGWHSEIADEYAACGRPFMGVIERAHGPAHLAGVAVYPADWRKRAPLLAAVLSAPDTFWGANLGQAFDTFAATETVPQAAEARTIQQIWRAGPVTPKFVREQIRAETALFHQDKSGQAIRSLREMNKL